LTAEPSSSTLRPASAGAPAAFLSW
jgi:hypothetical protein